MNREPANARSKDIDLTKPDDVLFWMDHYGCTEEQLRAAVKAAGVLAQDVREYIAKQAKDALKHNPPAGAQFHPALTACVASRRYGGERSWW